MAFLDHTSEVKVPYNKEDVIAAITEAIEKLKGMKIDTTDIITGRIIVKAGISAFSWGESITIIVNELPSNETNISIMSTPKTGALFGGAVDMGKNRKNINIIFNKISECLVSKNRLDKLSEQVSSIDDSIEKIKKLKSLLESNLISNEEFEKKRLEILERI